jgi:ABC-type multidrug transport system fused ATPase/permease subunit
MKALHVDFVTRTQWRSIWLLAVVAAVAAVATTLATYWKVYQNQRNLEQSILLLRQKAVAPTTPSTMPTDPRVANSRQAADLLQHDLNSVFTLVESIKAPNFRLRNLSLDSSAGTVRLEYELDSIPSAASLTLALNTGYSDHPWRLESVLANNNLLPSASNGQPATSPSTGAYRAVWSAHLHQR